MRIAKENVNSLQQSDNTRSLIRRAAGRVSSGSRSCINLEMNEDEDKSTLPPDGALHLHLISNAGKVDDGEVVANENSERTSDFLCSSCDRCRAKKTKCDGKRPCDTCKASHMRKNKIKHDLLAKEEVDLTVIECTYSLAKKRGPPPKAKSPAKDSSGDKEEAQVQNKKKQKKQVDVQLQPAAGSWQVRGAVSSDTAGGSSSNNATATSSMNPLGMTNPAASTWGLLQNQQARQQPILDILGTMSLLGMMNPASALGLQPQASLDPISAALQQFINPSMMGSTPGNNTVNMAQGQGFGGSIHATASSNAAQQYS